MRQPTMQRRLPRAHRRALPRVLAVVVLLTCHLHALPAAAVWGADVSAIADELMGQFAERLDQRIAELERDAAALRKGSAAHQELEQQIAQAQKARQYYARVETGVVLYSAAKDVRQAFNDLNSAAAASHLGAISPDQIAAAELAQSTALKALETADTALDYFNKLTALKDAVAKMSTAQFSPATQRLAAGLAAMSTVMAEFGEHVPLVGSVVQGYGQLGGAMLDALTELNHTLQDRQQGLLMVAGNTGLMAEMARAVPACPQQGEILAQAVHGLPGVYRSACHLLLWDKAANQFVNVSTSMPGRTLDQQVAELHARHVRFLQHGIVTPTPKQLTDDYARIALLRIDTPNRYVAGNQKLQLTARATRLSDGTPIDDTPVVAWSNTNTMRKLGPAGTFVAGPTPTLNKTVIWVSPDIDSGSRHVQVTLNDAHYIALKPASLILQVAQETRLEVSLIPHEIKVPPGSMLRIRAQLMLRKDNTPVRAGDALGEFAFSCDDCGDEGQQLATFSESEFRVQSALFRVPTTPGTYRLMAYFQGSGSTARAFAPSGAGYQFDVLPPDGDTDSDADTDTATDTDTALDTDIDTTPDTADTGSANTALDTDNAAMPAPDTSAAAPIDDAAVTDADFTGIWVGKAIAKAGKRTGPTKPIRLEIRQKDGVLTVVFVEPGLHIPAERQGFAIKGGKSLSEAVQAHWEGKVVNRQNIDINVDFDGQLSADKMTMTARGMYTVLGITIYERMALAKKDSGAALPPIPDDKPDAGAKRP
ncbi:MAG: hypothetical protein GX146_02685 [Myxococcales bacterium]|nr:hypothetical protein [Myxococcales bacterium]